MYISFLDRYSASTTTAFCSAMRSSSEEEPELYELLREEEEDDIAIKIDEGPGGVLGAKAENG